MGATNCPKCGKIFTKVNDPICKECMKAEEEKFEEVRLFVKEHPDCSPQEVSDACDISIKRILYYVRQGKLDISQGIDGLITCSKCGRPIKSGRMCEKCIKSTTSALEGIVAANSAASAPKVDASKTKTGMFTNK